MRALSAGEVRLLAFVPVLSVFALPFPFNDTFFAMVCAKEGRAHAPSSRVLRVTVRSALDLAVCLKNTFFWG
jgi:hypothetical protein